MDPRVLQLQDKLAVFVRNKDHVTDPNSGKETGATSKREGLGSVKNSTSRIKHGNKEAQVKKALKKLPNKTAGRQINDHPLNGSSCFPLSFEMGDVGLENVLNHTKLQASGVKNSF